MHLSPVLRASDVFLVATRKCGLATSPPSPSSPLTNAFPLRASVVLPRRSGPANENDLR